MLIKERIERAAGSTPVVLMGDFNCGRDSDPYRAITTADGAEPAIKDTFKLSAARHEGPDSTWNGFKEIAPGQVIDFIFVRGAIEVRRHATLEARVNRRFASDHLPVMADLVIEEAND
jgi:endonuclease/exonuclease/phosphatase family metal-dependent hydrolase